MKEFLTTDDLILHLNKYENDIIIVEEKKPKHKFKLNKKHIFVSIVILAVLHLVFMGLPLALKNESKELFGYQYVIAIRNDQELDNQLIGNVVRLEPHPIEDIAVGDSILVFGLYEVGDYYWELDVIDIDYDSQTLRASFDGIIKNTFDFDQVEGIIGDSANLLGIFYYTGSTPRGFIIMIFLHVIAVYAIYYLMFQTKNKKLKEVQDEEETK